MVGEDALGRYPKLGLAAKEELLRVVDLSMGNVLSDISFKLHEGEILGIAGLAGSGRTALVDAIFGVGSFVKGKMFLRGQEIKLKSPKQAIKLGFAYLAEDRVHAGLFSNLSVENNIVASNLKRVIRNGFISHSKEHQLALGLVKRLGMLINNVQQRVSTLSGGNQQKAMLAKWLFSGGYVYLLDEPTNGLDIASKVDIYNILNSIICGGSGIIMISSDLSELIGMCHRVLIIFKGRIVGELKGTEISEEKILKMASGRE
jgi:ribose transport system ATP-binding protein